MLVKIVFIVIAQQGYKQRQFDVIAMYLNAFRKDHEVVYIIQLVSFEYSEPDIGIKGWVYQLNQVLFGLRDLAILQNKELDNRLNKIDFYTLDDNLYIYIKKHNDLLLGNSIQFLLIYIDDFITAAPIDKEIKQIFQ